ncbi:MAG: hypothetical protein AB9866_24930 [Syntrophobacteraceae bacterium]
MDILKKPVRMWGRFFDLISSKNQSRVREKDLYATSRVSLSMGNEVLGEWLSMEKRPLRRS